MYHKNNGFFYKKVVRIIFLTILNHMFSLNFLFQNWPLAYVDSVWTLSRSTEPWICRTDSKIKVPV
jgi:hypothetical protein